MSRLNHFYFAVLGLFTFSQCETPIEFPEEARSPEIGLISEFTKDKTLEVRVFEGKFLFDAVQTHYIDDARVSIYKGDTFVEFLTLDKTKLPPSYVSETLIPVPNIEYRIQVEANGFEPVMARSRVPDSTPIKEAVVSDFLKVEKEGAPQNHISYKVNVSFKDQLKESNFYHLNFVQEILKAKDMHDDSEGPGPEMRKVSFSSVQDNNQFIAFSNGGLLFSDESFEGQLFDNQFSLQFDLEEKEFLGMLYIELRSVSEEYYLFQTSLSRQGSNPGQPIDDGVSIYNNIENGRGIFAGYNISQKAIDLFE